MTTVMDLEGIMLYEKNKQTNKQKNRETSTEWHYSYVASKKT